MIRNTVKNVSLFMLLIFGVIYTIHIYLNSLIKRAIETRSNGQYSVVHIYTDYINNTFDVVIKLNQPLETSKLKVSFDTALIHANVFPVFSDCELSISGMYIHGPLRPALLASEWGKMADISGGWCRNINAGGEGILGDSPPVNVSIQKWILGFDEESENPNLQSMRIVFDSINGQSTLFRLAMTQPSIRNSPGLDTGIGKSFSVEGDWSLGGMDLTHLFSKIGVHWNVKTDLGFLKFKSSLNTDGTETGNIKIGQWVLEGNSKNHPTRVSITNLSSGFVLTDTELIFENLRVKQPHVDVIGVQGKTVQSWLRPATWAKTSAKQRRPLSVHGHGTSNTGKDSVMNISINEAVSDSGTLVMIDKPEMTKFLMRADNISIIILHSAKLDDEKPNTEIFMDIDGNKKLEIKAITDFSTWPPGYRLIDVRKIDDDNLDR